MAKQVVKNYTYSKSAKTITFTDYSAIRLDRVLLIVDATINAIIYNFADSTVATATVGTNILTLSVVPASSADADKLIIFYDTLTADPTTDVVPVRVSDGTNNMPTGDASARTIHTTIDNASVTVAAGTNLNTSALALETGGNLATAATNTGTTATNTTNVPNVIGTAASAIPSKLLQVGGSDGTLARALKTNTSGQLDVRPLTASDAITEANSSAIKSDLDTLAGIVGSSKAAVKTADGDQVTVGAKADAKSSATDTTAITLMQVLKQLSYQLQTTQPTLLNKQWAATGTLVANTVTTATTAQTLLDGTAFTAYELEVTNLDGAAEILFVLDPVTKSVTATNTGADTATVTGHGLGTTLVYPIAFTAVGFTNGSSLNTTGTIYYVKGTDANTLKFYTDSAAASPVDITSNSTATFYLAPTRTNVAHFIASLPATPYSIVVPSYNTAPVVRILSAGTPQYRVVLRGGAAAG